MNVTELIAALQALAPDTPVSHELVAELVQVDEAAVYRGGWSSFHPSIYTFRKQRYLRAAAATKRAILKLREAGWDARVSHQSLHGEKCFVKDISFVIVPITPGPDEVTYRQQDEAEKLIAPEMADWPYDVNNGWAVTSESHQAKFDAALTIEDIEASNKEAFVVFASDLVSKKVRDSIFEKGQPLLYETKTSGEITREWPDGRREIVQRQADGTLVVVRVVEGSGEES